MILYIIRVCVGRCQGRVQSSGQRVGQERQRPTAPAPLVHWTRVRGRPCRLPRAEQPQPPSGNLRY